VKVVLLLDGDAAGALAIKRNAATLLNSTMQVSRAAQQPRLETRC
jgi:DNA primase